MTCLFSREQVSELYDGLENVQSKADEITDLLLCWDYQTAKGREYGTHALARRIMSITRCIQQVYDLLPPELESVPDRDVRNDAEIYIQGAIFHIYGALENLAFIWAFERSVMDKKGRPLTNVKIGFRPKNREMWSSMKDDLQTYFQSGAEWRANLESFRHSLGHRIPLYIPPFMIDPGSADEYNDLAQSKIDALGKARSREYEDLSNQQGRLRHFKPMILHSLNEGSRPILFHAQLLADFNTLEEACRMIFDRLKD